MVSECGAACVMLHILSVPVPPHHPVYGSPHSTNVCQPQLHTRTHTHTPQQFIGTVYVVKRRWKCFWQPTAFLVRTHTHLALSCSTPLRMDGLFLSETGDLCLGLFLTSSGASLLPALALHFFFLLCVCKSEPVVYPRKRERGRQNVREGK